MKISVLKYIGATAIILLSASCSKIGNYAERKADDAAYGNIRGAQLRGMGDTDPFSIDDEQIDLVRELLEMDKTVEDAEV